MKYTVHVKTRQRANSVDQDTRTSNTLVVKTTAVPTENAANKSVILQVSEYLSIPKSRIRIIKGMKCKTKIIECATTSS